MRTLPADVMPDVLPGVLHDVLPGVLLNALLGVLIDALPAAPLPTRKTLLACAAALCENTGLRCLVLWSNGIGHQGVAALSEGLMVNETLQARPVVLYPPPPRGGVFTLHRPRLQLFSQ